LDAPPVEAASKEKIGQDAGARIAPLARERMSREIADTGGREVFFAGSLDARGAVERVRVCARGTDTAVPAFFEILAPRDVIIHNHPSGDIAPSNPDLDIASICGNNGHGVYIVDNSVERVYVVVEPFLDKEIRKLDPAEMQALFLPGSKIARALPHFEVRPQQTRMMSMTARAFNHDGIAVIEAPTGVGKTLAYLLPSVLWSLRNRERVVISTRTINLQEQIIFKDIPALKKCIDEDFSAVLVKGRSNYLCRRKLARVLSEASLYDEENGILKIGEWAEKTVDGSRSDLPFMPSREVWESVCSEADACSGSRCPHSKDCFVTKARREVAKADIIVANHHILFSDISVKKDLGDFCSLAVLPAYKRVIFDEAHSIEDSATEYFGTEATRLGALALMGRFHRRERSHEQGLLPFIRARLMKEQLRLRPQEKEEILTSLENDVMPSVAVVRESFTIAFDALRKVAATKSGQIGRDIKWRLTEKELADPDLREAHSVHVSAAFHDARALAMSCHGLIDRLKKTRGAPDDPESAFVVEIAELQAYCARLESLGDALLKTTSEEPQPDMVRWIEIDGMEPKIVRAICCPLEVGTRLAEWVYGNLKTVVMTSATLTVRREFEYFFERIGLNRVDPDRLETGVLDSPFNYEKQAIMCSALDIPSPDDKKFLDESVESIRRVLSITKGHALVLFTSFYALDYTFRRLDDDLRKAGITALRQGGAARTQLLDIFRSDLSSVLFATDSFWEGIDVAGDALQCVIVSKLPFRVPTEPIQQARAEAIDLASGNSFMKYTVPQAVIKFRQGFGRLIRRRTDRGAIVVLDRRLLTKYYGRVFLESLPGVPIKRGTRQELFEIMEEFYKK
jgi:ATP-dependent DNA helicase DinG